MSLKLRFSHYNEGDWRAFTRMSKAFVSASPYSKMAMSNKKLYELFISQDNYHLLLFLVDEFDKPVGMIYGIISTTPFSEEKVASELAWWVDHEYRGKDSVILVEAYQDWALRMGASHVTVALLEGFTNPKIESLYKRMGFSLAERSYIKEL